MSLSTDVAGKIVAKNKCEALKAPTGSCSNRVTCPRSGKRNPNRNPNSNPNLNPHPNPHPNPNAPPGGAMIPMDLLNGRLSAEAHDRLALTLTLTLTLTLPAHQFAFLS